MKEKLKHLLPIVAFAIFFVYCSDKEEDPTPPKKLTDNEYNNYWIYNKMKRLYLWNDKLPASPDYTVDPEDFFYNILFDYGKATGDRFSVIAPDETKSVKSAIELNKGFEIMPAQYFPDMGTGTSSLGFFVVSVQKDSDAYAKGLRRGCVIYAVDGEPASANNYYTIMNNASFTPSIYNIVGDKLIFQTVVNQIFCRNAFFHDLFHFFNHTLFQPFF